MKITLNRQSRMFLIHKLANALERNTNWNAYVEYYWKGDDGLKRARFDIVLYDEELNIKAIFTVLHKKKLKFTTIKFNNFMSDFVINSKMKRYNEVFSKHNIPVFLVNLNENNESKVLEDILEQL